MRLDAQENETSDMRKKDEHKQGDEATKKRKAEGDVVSRPGGNAELHARGHPGHARQPTRPSITSARR